MATASRLRRILTSAVAALAGLVLTLGAPPSTAHAAPATGTISGTITDSHGPINGALVTADSSISTGTSVLTDADGHFTFTLDVGTYRVLASDPDHHLMKWIGGTEYDSATAFTVSATPVTGVDAQLTRLASIRGTIHTVAGGAAVGAKVTAWVTGGNGGATATADSSGNFTMDVAPATYLVQAVMEGASPVTFYSAAGSVSQRAQATVFTLKEDDTQVSNINLLAGTTFSGTVTSNGTTPATAISIQGRQQVGSDWINVSQTTTDASGHYSLILGQGTYYITFYQLSTGRYGEQKVVVGPGSGSQTLNIDCLPLYDTTATPTITGTATVGSTLTANAGTWDPTPDSFTYQWLRNDVEIPGATQASYTVTVADVGAAITVITTAIKTGYFHDYYQSDPTAKVPALPITGSKPTISGKAKVGKKLTVHRGTWHPSGLTFTYQWYRNGTAIKKATKTTYKVTKSDKRKYLTVKVTAKRTGYKTLSLTSKKTAKVR